MTIRYHTDLIQGSEEWHAARCGLLTASEMGSILTPTLKPAKNDKSRAHVWEILAQRISGYVEPTYQGYDMLRGQEDEILARDLYARSYAPVRQVGFVTNDEWGFTLGYSPDGLVGDDGLIEAKSRKQRFQVETIVAYAERGETPIDFALQIQTGLLVTKRNWCDLLSYSGGLPMVAMRVEKHPDMQAAILTAAKAFEDDVAEKRAIWDAAQQSGLRLQPTPRRVEEEMR